MKLLVDKSEYMKARVNLGSKYRTGYMKQFIFKIRRDGVSVLDIVKIDERIRVAGSFLAKYENIAVISRRENVKNAVKKFAEAIDAKAFVGRYFPGTMTNYNTTREFYEPDVVFVIDPWLDRKAISDALKVNVPIVALCNTNNQINNIDLIIPANNKYNKSVGLVLYLLAREILKNRGKIKSNEEFTYKLEEFF